MILSAIKNAFLKAKERNWDRIYIAIDIHDTIVESNYEVNNIPRDFYPYAKEVLQILSKRDDVVLILYTCSHPHEITEYLQFFNDNGIHFNYVNENPEVKTDCNGYGNYDKKFYFNVLMDDKAGFNPKLEWEAIYWYFTPQENNPYIITYDTFINVRHEYNENYGNDKECECGHPYYRHFDTYEQMSPIGCKYCECYRFVQSKKK